MLTATHPCGDHSIMDTCLAFKSKCSRSVPPTLKCYPSYSYTDIPCLQFSCKRIRILDKQHFVDLNPWTLESNPTIHKDIPHRPNKGNIQFKA